MKKLTLVSVSAKGVLISAFFMLPIENGKAIISQEVISAMTQKIGCAEGMTFSIG